MHYSKRLKEKIAKLESDIYKIIDGDQSTILDYRFKRNAEQSINEWIIFGRSMKTSARDIIPFLMHKSVYPGEHIST